MEKKEKLALVLGIELNMQIEGWKKNSGPSW
jgi:hypothetical protein